MKMIHDHKQIGALLATYGELDGATRRQVDEHLAHCPACAAVFAAHRQTDHLLRTWTAQKEQQLRQQPGSSTGAPPVCMRQAIQRTRTPRRDNLLFFLARLRTPFLQASVGGTLLLLLGLLAFNFSRQLPIVEIGRTPMPTATTMASLPATTQQTTIRFAVPQRDKGNYLPFVYAFEAANPDLQVEIISFEEILGVKVGGDWLDDNFPKVAAAADVIDAFIDPNIITKGFVHNLTPILTTDPTFAIHDYYPNALAPYQWQGGLWALPSLVNIALIYYDKDAFVEAGVAYPQPGWTWEEFVATAKALTKRQGDEVQRWGYVESWFSPQLFIESQAGPLFDTSTTPVTSRLLNPDVLTAFQRYLNLYTVDKVSPYQEQPQLDTYTSSQYIPAGKAAMWSGTLIEWGKYRGRNLGVVPYPVNEKRMNSSQMDSFLTIAMSAQTRHPKEAWRWMSFLSTKITKPYSPEITLPARKSAAEATKAWEKLAPELTPTLRYALDHSYPQNDAYYAVNSPEVWEVLNAAFAAALQGQKSVDVAMAEVQVMAQRQLLIAADPPAAQCQISIPTEGAIVSGTVTLQGIATNPTFAYYQVFYASDHGVPESLTFLLQESQPVQNGELGRFDSTIVPDGPYTLSLRVVDQSSNYTECLVHIVVQQPSPAVTNSSPARCLARDAVITAPAEGETVSGVVTLRGTATDPSFAYYHVLYKPRNGRQNDWGFLFEEKEAVQEGILGRLDSTILPDGPYTLSLRVVDQTDNYAECLVNIEVGN